MRVVIFENYENPYFFSLVRCVHEQKGEQPAIRGSRERYASKGRFIYDLAARLC